MCKQLHQEAKHEKLTSLSIFKNPTIDFLPNINLNIRCLYQSDVKQMTQQDNQVQVMM